MKTNLIHCLLFLIFFSAKNYAQITIDGDFSDWAGVPVLINDATGDGDSGWDIDNVYVTDDATNVYFRIQFTSSVAGSKSLYLLISVDPQNEPTTRTGLSYGWWDNGYDFMVQYYAPNNKLYRHAGGTETGWNWEDNYSTNSQMWKQTSGSNDYSDIEIAVSKADLDNPNIAGWTPGTQNSIAVMTFVDNNYAEEAGSGSNHGGVVYNLSNGPLPVELVSFSANLKESFVQLNWKTATEVNNYGFEVQRKNVSGEWKKVGFVKGNGNSNSPKHYTFSDKTVHSGKYFYRLKQIDIDGSFNYSKIVEVDVSAPVKYELSQNFPNPFNPTTVIKYSIPEDNYVTIKLYNVLGKEIGTLVNDFKQAGKYKVSFDGSNLPSGIYFYTIQSGNFRQVKKMILQK